MLLHPEEDANIFGESISFTLDVLTGSLSGGDFKERFAESSVCLELDNSHAHACYRLFGERVTDIRMVRVPYGHHTVVTYLLDGNTRQLLPETRRERHFRTTDQKKLAPPYPLPKKYLHSTKTLRTR